MQFVRTTAVSDGEEKVTNLSDRSRRYLESLGYADIDSKADTYSSLWLHALAIGFSRKYLAEHGEGIAIGWPRIPIPAQRTIFEQSVLLGRKIANLLDMDSPIDGGRPEKWESIRRYWGSYLQRICLCEQVGDIRTRRAV